jgi:alkylated DNA repair protein (DNA oxidative demethylase)
MTIPPGFKHFKRWVNPVIRTGIIDELHRLVFPAAPLFRPAMPGSGTPFSLRLTNAGRTGWISDVSGYRYAAHHPETQVSWPPIPPLVTTLVRAIADMSGYPDFQPDCCLINLYEDANSKLGLHRDEEEEDRESPIISVSIGDAAQFEIGGLAKTDPRTKILVESGDVIVMGGQSRAAYHRLTKIFAGSGCDDLRGLKGRINLTIRQVLRRNALAQSA